MADDPHPPRRRRRAVAQQGPPERGLPEAGAPARKKPRAAPRENVERGLRDIVGSGPSALSLSAALRARDLNRPTEDDLAEAERDIVIVRRNWKPPAN